MVWTLYNCCLRWCMSHEQWLFCYHNEIWFHIPNTCAVSIPQRNKSPCNCLIYHAHFMPNAVPRTENIIYWISEAYWCVDGEFMLLICTQHVIFPSSQFNIYWGLPNQFTKIPIIILLPLLDALSCMLAWGLAPSNLYPTHGCLLGPPLFTGQISVLPGCHHWYWRLLGCFVTIIPPCHWPTCHSWMFSATPCTRLLRNNLIFMLTWNSQPMSVPNTEIWFYWIQSASSWAVVTAVTVVAVISNYCIIRYVYTVLSAAPHTSAYLIHT